MRKSTKTWLTAAVVTVGVADCVGIYVAQNRLAQPVPADMGDDLAYAMPADAGVFRPDQGMPSLTPRLAVARPEDAKAGSGKGAAQLAVAAPPAPKASRVKPATAAATAPHFAVVAPAIAPLHRTASASASSQGSVRIARNDRAAPAAGALAKVAAPQGSARHVASRTPSSHTAASRAASHRAADTNLAGLIAPRHQDRLFAAAFSGFANVPLDAPITVQLDDAQSQSALADEGTAADPQLAHNSAPADTANDAAANAAAELPPVGPAVTMPDSDKL